MPEARPISHQKVPLPIDPFLPEIVEQARRHRALVLVAEPGAGKTTRVPPALVASGILGSEHPSLVMLQPRRVAARAAAARIAEENGWDVGQEVGYHVRFERRIGRDTRLRVLTEGILIRQLVDDPFLEGVGCVVLDEFHERSIHTDLSIALVREVREQVREDLIVIVMSATLEAEPVARFLGDCPIIRVPGRTHPVDVRYSPSTTHAPLPDRVARAVMDVLDRSAERSSHTTPVSERSEELDRSGDAGDILVFLPGVEEIRRTMHRLETLAQRDDLLVLPLHGTLPLDEQVRAIRPADQRRIVLATNIAETSLTIEGVTTVIDSGLARVAAFDAQRGLDRLELKRISKASATQRAGRAGRTRPGRCIRLWSAREQAAMPDFERPEIHRVDLASTVLTLHAWGRDEPRQFGWYEPPPEPMLASAERLLAMLGALTSETNGRITDLGKRLMSLPVHPRLARLLIAASDAGAVEQGATLAALLSEKDILLARTSDAAIDRPAVKGSSDLHYRRDLLDRAERDRFHPTLRDEGIDPIAARQVARTRDDLLRVAGRHRGHETGTSHHAPDDVLLRILLLAYPDRVCRRRASDPMTGAMVGGGGVRLAPDAIVKQPEFFLALDARGDDRARAKQATVRIASAIEPAWLEELFPEHMRRERSAQYDEQRDRVVGVGRVLYRDLVLREDLDASVDPSTAAQTLASAVESIGIRELLGEGAQQWLARFDLLRKAMPEQGWPVIGDDDAVHNALVVACQGKRSLRELQPALRGALQSMLDYRLARMIDIEAPETIEVPTGNRIRLDYPRQTEGTDGIQPPVLAVRLQELFGLTDTPRIAGGRVPVVLHLLGPNYRPVQVTSDLRSFWINTYPQVRKDLRARYPKHSWPEDPLSAKPEAKGGRRR